MKKSLSLVLIAVLVLTSFVAAVAWPFPKAQTCAFMNLTDAACDQAWCNIQEGEYNATREVCFVTINNTIISNETNQSNFTGFNESLYYNKTESDALYSTKNETLTLRDSVSDQYALKSEVTALSSPASTSSSKILGFDIGTIVVILIIAIAGFLLFKGRTSQQITPAQRGDAPQAQPLIQGKKEIEREARMDRMLDEIEEMKREKRRENKNRNQNQRKRDKIKKSKKPLKQEDEDEDSGFEDDDED